MSQDKLEPRKWPARDADAAFLDHLERRRNSLEQAMWQAPALTIAAQAFLLAVLTDGAVDRWVRGAVLAAGVLASVAAGVSLLRLRSREVLYSEAIAYYCAAFGIRDPRPDGLRRKAAEPTGRWERIDRGLREWIGGSWLPPVYWLWLFALVAFVVADVAALLCVDSARAP